MKAGKAIVAELQSIDQSWVMPGAPWRAKNWSRQNEFPFSEQILRPEANV
jgi:hypothetical protein